ncbi:MAG: aldose 1-epimerase family protein [bacterium]|nr:aldose 1-epimerase family protein [bacterium]
MPDPTQWKHDELTKHSVDTRQFIDFRLSTLPTGMRIIDAHNSSGLHFTLLPDRGLDIWTAHYKGLPLTWISQGSPHPPDYGQSWLRQFNGGLLTTCGLTHVGSPEVDEITGEQRDLHGNFTRLRAEIIENTAEWDFNGVYQALLRGRLSESCLFGEQLAVERIYWLTLGKPSISICTIVTNRSDVPTPLMLLYHFNLGFPLVQQGTRLTTAGSVYPRDDVARMGLGTWSKYARPTENFAEQVYYHRVSAHRDKGGRDVSYAALTHEDFGLQLEWQTDTLPYLTQWKNTRRGMYVSGIEPGNCIPEGQNAARRAGRLQMLAPGETVRFDCNLTVLDGKAAVDEARARIEELKAVGVPVEGCNLTDYAQP